MTTHSWDAIVIGGGINGLACAAALARAGRKVVVLEARDEVGGGACSAEIAPGFRVPRLAHVTGPLSRDLLAYLPAPRDLTFVQTPVSVAGLSPEGGALVVYDDAERTSVELARWSARDAEAWPAFARARTALGRVIGSLFAHTPPAIDDIGRRDAWQLLQTAREFRALSTVDRHRLLRWGPMAVADLVSECFEHELLRATIAGDGILGAMLGPWSAGSGMQLLLAAANEAVGDTTTRFVRGGPGQLAAALARTVQESGGIVRTGARVARVLVRNDRATAVALENGDEIGARAVVSGLDPKRTFLDLCDAADLGPEFLWRARNYRARGVLAKVNLALSAAPAFNGVSAEALSGRVRVGATLDALERAFDHVKYGRMSPRPWIEFTLPSLIDPTLAPLGAHVLSAYVQFAPFEPRGATWTDARAALQASVIDTLDRYAPGIGRLVVAADVLTPADLEREWGCSGGHIHHGELALDQLWAMRPLLGWAAYRAPIDGLFLCGSGTHPGTGLTGRSGLNAAAEILRT